MRTVQQRSEKMPELRLVVSLSEWLVLPKQIPCSSWTMQAVHATELWPCPRSSYVVRQENN